MSQSYPNDPLPYPLTSLIGREQEIASLRELLSAEGGGVRLLTLTGAAGSGKTRLAISVGATVTDDFPDGVWWADLSLISDSSAVAQAVANALRVTLSRQSEPGDALVRHLADSRLLLILDNCEHVIEGSAVLVQRLLGACPRLQILATSRESLKIPGETVWLTPLLAVPRRGTTPPVDELLNYAGIRLWVERARAAFPGFRLTAENAAAVVQVCQRLDGMPLAIELAAARVKVLSVEQIAARLDDRFRLLKADMRTVLPRNQTLQATIDWSYALLSEGERVLLQALSVFVGGCTLEAVEYLVVDDAHFVDDLALDVLARLVEKSLVVVEQREHWGARYDLLETIRQYALGKLTGATGEERVRRRHRDWFLMRAEAFYPKVGSAQQSNWLADMDAEYENYRAALAWSRETPGEAQEGLRLACLLRHYWDRKGYVQDALAALQGVLAHPANRGPSAQRAEALNVLGFFTLLHGAAAQAIALYEEALVIGETLQDPTTVAMSCAGLVFVLAGSAEPHKAEPYIAQGLAAARQINDATRTYNLLFYASWLALAEGDIARAQSLLTESLALMRAKQDTNLIGAALWRLGHLCWLDKRYAESLAAFQESLQVRRSLNSARGVAYAVDGVAWVAAASGDPALAARLFGAADTQFTAMGSHFHPLEQPAHDAAVSQARSRLGNQAFAAAWADGAQVSLDEAAIAAQGFTLSPQPVASAPRQAADPPLLRLYGLGPVQVAVGDRPVQPADWSYAKARDLLFFLVTEGPATREQIGLVFWPDASPEQLRRNLGVTLHHLRRALGRSEWVIFEKDRYAFNRSLGHWYDVEIFAALHWRAGQNPNEAEILREALAIYRGEFLADANVGEWYFPRRESLARQYEEMLFALAQLHWSAGDLSAAAELYRQAIRHDPYQEAAYRNLMDCLARMGEQAQALRVYAELARMMKNEFASVPSRETQEVYARLRAG